jgi:hypothetical protein
VEQCHSAPTGWPSGERALVYKTLVLTGLRSGELDSLTVSQLSLDEQLAFVVLDAADEKNREGSETPLRADLAEDLRDWIANRPGDSPLFYVPTGLIRILERDLKLAGIPKQDDRGRTLDVYALRHTFGTLLSKNGVSPRTAQEAMRHSSIDLTMNVYTDPRLLDTHAAVESLPALPLNYQPGREREVVKATGTDGKAVRTLAPMLAPNSDNRCKLGTIPDNSTADSKPAPNATKPRETKDFTGFSKERARGFEPPTYSLGKFPSRRKSPAFNRLRFAYFA